MKATRGLTTGCSRRCSAALRNAAEPDRWAAGRILLNGAKMDDTKRKLLKLVLVCLICIGLVTGLALLIQSLTR